MATPGTNNVPNRPVNQPAPPAAEGGKAPPASGQAGQGVDPQVAAALVEQFMKGGGDLSSLAEAATGTLTAGLLDAGKEALQEKMAATNRLNDAALDNSNANHSIANQSKKDAEAQKKAEDTRKDRAEDHDKQKQTEKAKIAEAGEQQQKRALAQEAAHKKFADMQQGKRPPADIKSTTPKDANQLLAKVTGQLKDPKLAKAREQVIKQDPQLAKLNQQKPKLVQKHLENTQKLFLLKSQQGQLPPAQQKALQAQIAKLSQMLDKSGAEIKEALGSKEKVPPALLNAEKKVKQQAKDHFDADKAEAKEGESGTKSARGEMEGRVAKTREQKGEGQQGQQDPGASQAPVVAQAAVSLQEAVERRGVTFLGTDREEAVQRSANRCLAAMEAGASHALCAEEGEGEEGLVRKVYARQRNQEEGEHGLDAVEAFPGQEGEGEIRVANYEQGGLPLINVESKPGKIFNPFQVNEDGDFSPEEVRSAQALLRGNGELPGALHYGAMRIARHGSLGSYSSGQMA